MREFKNEATLSTQEIKAKRAAIEHRATWFALIFDEARKAGIENIEDILRAAIKKTGLIHGARYRESFKDEDDFRELVDQFLSPTALECFEQEVTLCTYNELAADFNYCPFVTAFKKLELSDEDIALLCDIAMDGDRGVAEAMGANLDIPKRIAYGDDCCQIHFTRQNNEK